MAVPVATILVISDLHIGSLADGQSQSFLSPLTPFDPSEARIVSLLDQLKKAAIAPTHLLVLGDLTSSAEPSEFNRSLDITNEIAKALDLSSSHVINIFGNHDVNWRISRLSETDLVAGSANPRQHTEREQRYRDLAIAAPATLVPLPDSANRSKLPGVATISLPPIELAILNSTMACTHDVKPQHGDIGDEQFYWLEQNLPLMNQSRDVYRIAIVHHHVREFQYPTGYKDFSVMQGSDRLLKLFGKSNIDLILHGHRHHPYITTIRETGFNQPCTIISAGSFSVNPVQRNSGTIPNLAHIIQLYERSDSGAGRGRLLTYKFSPKREWELATSEDSTGTTPVIWFEDAYGPNDYARAADVVIAQYIATTRILPPYDQLPTILRSLPIHRLNDVLEEVAGKRGRLLSGGYAMKPNFHVSGTPVIL